MMTTFYLTTRRRWLRKPVRIEVHLPDPSPYDASINDGGDQIDVYVEVRHTD